MSQAGQNLKYLRKLRGWTQEEFAVKLGIKRSLIGAYEEERADPRLEVLEIVGDTFKLSLDELLLKDLSNTGDSFLAKRRQQKMMTVDRNLIHFVPVKAAAGYLAGYADSEFIDELNTFTLPMLSGGNYRAFEIIGDSMLPTPSGSVIVGERVASLKDVKSSNTYIVISNTDGVVYKRIITNDDRSVDTIGEKLTLLSDNPLYEPYQVNTKDIVEVWKAVYIIHKAGAQPMWNVDQLAGVVNTLQDQITSIQKKLN